MTDTNDGPAKGRLAKADMDKIAAFVNDVLNRNPDQPRGWVVLAFPSGKKATASYVSNLKARDSIGLLRETADDLEQHVDVESTGPN